MSSSRLPNKVLLDIAGQPALAHVVERTRRSRMVDDVVVATAKDSLDDPIESFCEERSYLYYRGEQHDVLDRYYQAALIYEADIIVRITGDCPLIDPDVVDKTVCAFLGYANGEIGTNYKKDQLERNLRNKSSYNPPYDFAANRFPPPWDAPIQSDWTPRYALSPD